MKRSKRIETLDKRPVNLDGYINEWPEMGFVAMKSPYDPTPSVKVQDGKIVELDGKKREDFDFIDQFIADYAINIENVPGESANVKLCKKDHDLFETDLYLKIFEDNKFLNNL